MTETADLTPATLGIDAPKFAGGFRPVQLQAIDHIRSSEAKVSFVQAPTGAGKGLLARALGAVLRLPTSYCATTKDLQAQFCRDFPDSVELRGRGNYRTDHGPITVTCEDCDYDKKSGCSWCGELGDAESAVWACPYRQQKRAALAAPFVVLNTSYFITEANNVGGFSSEERLVVIDEADQLEKLLLDAISLDISERRLTELGLPTPRRTDRPESENWLPWLRLAHQRASERYGELQQRLAEWEGDKSNGYLSLKRDVDSWSSLWVHLGWTIQALEEEPTSWVRVDVDKGLSFKPIRVGPYARNLLWQHARRFVLLSATIIDPAQFAADLGLEEGEWDSIDLPSDFPPENRPVIYRPVGSMARRHREDTVPLMVEEIDRILDGCNERVLIHTHTYGLARDLLSLSDHGFRMITYVSAAERERALQELRATVNGVLVAPSMARGVDLADDLCRVVIVMVVPKPYYGDARVRLRLALPDGESWNRLHQIRELCQMTGRGVRHREDHCTSYILDSEFGRLNRLATARRAFPKWWKVALKTALEA